MKSIEEIKSNLRDIISINKDTITSDVILMNEIVIDELMLDLGYNKKRDKSVRRLHDGQVDWEIKQGDDCLIAVKVLALLDTNISSEIQKAEEYALDNKFEVLLITNGNTIDIKSLNYEKDSYEDIITIDINEETTDREEKAMQAISKEGLNLEKLDEIKIRLTEQDIKNALLEHIDEVTLDIKKSLQKWLDISNSGLIDKLIEESGILEPSFMFNMDKNSSLESTEEDFIDWGSTDTADTEAEETIKELKELIKKQQETIDNLRNSEDTESNQLEELEKKVEQLEEELVDKENLLKHKESEVQNKLKEIEDKNNEINKLKEEIENTEQEIENTENDKTEIEELKLQLENKESVIEELTEKLKTASEVTSTSSSTSTSTSSENSSDEVEDYRNQIANLSNELSEYKEKVEKLEEELQTSKDELNSLSGAGRQRALELLGVIEDNEELDRHYVGVINTELIQFDLINTFVGRSLQKLYELKSFEASQYIFNGDIFKLVQPAKRNDLIMNNKAYDIDLSNEHEDDVLNKIRIVFSHFEDVIFECKKIGTIKNKVQTTQQEVETVSDNLNNSDSEEETLELPDDLFDKFEGADLVENSMQSEDTDKNKDKVLIAGQLLNIDSLVWSEEEIEFSNIKYVGSNSMTFNVNMNNEDITNEQLLCKCIDAVLALSETNKSELVTKLKQTDLSMINNFIKLYTTEYKEYPRINGTKYVVTGMESIKQVASVLLDICNELQIDTSDIFLYFAVTTSSEFIKTNYEFPEDAIQLRDYSNYDKNETYEEATSIIKGNMFNSIVVTKNSLRAHREIFDKAVAIKTKYLAKALNTQEDLINTVSEMIVEAENTGEINNILSIGNVVGEGYKLLSEDANEVGDYPIEIVGQANTYYMATIEDWQVVHSLLKIHTSLFNNTAIAIKTIVDMDAIRFYEKQFETSEPSLCLAVRSIAEYVEACIK